MVVYTRFLIFVFTVKWYEINTVLEQQMYEKYECKPTASAASLNPASLDTFLDEREIM